MSIFWGALFWCIYFPLVNFAGLFFLGHSKIQARRRFEKKNKFEALAHSFKEKKIVADVCFEFSSEGEFQQVAPLIEDALKLGKKIELVFFSPSVEESVLVLASTYPQQIRYLRFPFLRIFPFISRRSFNHWVTAKTLILVRYDLFPDFLLWSLKTDHELKLVWMTFKKERSQGHGPSFWKKIYLKRASSIVFADERSLKDGQEIGLDGKIFDFRIEQILRRVELKLEKFKNVFPLYLEFKNALEVFPREKRLIMGNAWPSDLFLLKHLPDDFMLVVVPHQLSADIIDQFKQGLGKLGRKTIEVPGEMDCFKNGSTILINQKGILCELYADFSLAYVGGGFEGSIHSVLEPMVAGVSSVACGPFHHRSTEYDLVQDFGNISEINTPEEFIIWLKKPVNQLGHVRISSVVNSYSSLREFVISC